jgi:hypothetical protein
MVGWTVMDHVASIRPELWDAFDVLTGFTEKKVDFAREDPSLDAQIDAFLVRSHLSEIVDALIQSLSAEET